MILFEKSDERDIMMEQMDNVLSESNYMIEYIKFNNGTPTAFKHPGTNQIYEITTNFIDRRNIINGLSEK